MRKKIGLDDCIPVRLIDWDHLRDAGHETGEVEKSGGDAYETIGEAPLKKLVMSNSLYNLCCRYGLEKAADLLSFSEEEWKEKPGIGKKSWQELQALLDWVRTYKDKRLSEEEPQSLVWTYLIAFDTPLMEIKSLTMTVNKLLAEYGILTLDDLLHHHPKDWQQITKLGKWRRKEYLEAAEDFREEMYLSMERKLLCHYEGAMTAEALRPLLQWADMTHTTYKTLLVLLEKAGYPTEIGTWSDLLCHNEETAGHAERYVLDRLEEEEFGSLSAEELEGLFPSHLCPLSWIGSILQKLLEEKKVGCEEGKYFLRYPSFHDFLAHMDEKGKGFVQCRLQGMTLDEIAKPYGVTRERVRQFLTRFLKQVPRVEEMRFMDQKILWEGLTDEDFAYLFDLPEETVRFLDYYMDEHPGKVSTEERLERLREIEGDSAVPEVVRSRARERQRELCPVLETEEGPIPATQEALLDYVFMKEGKEGIGWQSLIDRCNELLHKEWPEWEERLFINYWYADKFIKSPKLLVSRHKYMRYYDIEAKDYGLLWEALQLSQYENVEITTRKLFRSHPKLMKLYDIRDFYELHNLLKKWKVIEADTVEKALPVDMSCNLAPTLLFGKVDRERQVYQVLHGRGLLPERRWPKKWTKPMGLQARICITTIGIWSFPPLEKGICTRHK